MEPKTAIQKKVAALSAKLPVISDKQKQYAFDKCFDMYVSRSRKTLYCLECGHSWAEQSSLITAVACSCPSCGKDLKLKPIYQSGYKDNEYYAVITTKGDMQVVRMFFVTKYMRKLEMASFGIIECMRFFIGENGKITSMSIKVMGLSGYIDQWVSESNMEIRNTGPRSHLQPSVIYPQRRILPLLKRNGFNGHFYDCNPSSFISMLLTDPKAETLIKAGQSDMLRIRYSKSPSVDKFWPSVRICIRNKYIIKNARLWIDYLELLEDIGKDLLNAKYVCPMNLKSVHDKLVEKAEKTRKKEEIEKMKKKLEKLDIEYKINKGRFMDVQFREGSLRVAVIESVTEMMIEGDELHHCVFSSKYYDKAKSLILSARMGSKRMETVEVDLNDMKILQSRGLRNKNSLYHDRIIGLVEKNMNKISKLAQV